MMGRLGGGEGGGVMGSPVLLEVGKGDENGNAEGEAQKELEGRGRPATGTRGRALEFLHFRKKTGVS
jgi:hypothetical protein